MESDRDAIRLGQLSREVLDSLHEGCQVLGTDWRYLYVNDAVVAQSRKTRDELIGRTMMECYPGIEQTPMFDALRRCMHERTSSRLENEFTFADGARTWFELRIVPVPQGVCVLSIDVTERRHRLAAIVDDSFDAIIGVRLDGVITSWNVAATRMFGWSSAEIVGMSIDVLVPERLRAERASVAQRLVDGERVAPFGTVRRRKDGTEIDVSVTASPVRGSDGTVIGVSMIQRDVSELKQLHAELVRAKEEAEVSARELESFSYSVAHDLRAPLRSIDGFSAALLEEYADKVDDDGKRFLRFVREGAQRMGELIDDILMLSRVTRAELDPAPTDLTELAQRALRRLAQRQPERNVETHVHPGLTAIADERLLAIALESLIDNAWKFSSGREVAHIEVGARREGDETIFFVRDDGAGFDPAYAQKLFGVFQRLHGEREFEGTGVGLATVKRIVARHRGRVWAESTVGSGATFFFTLGDGAER